MPLYEYRCLDCAITFEKLRAKRQADDPIACKHCQSQNTKRAISLFAAHGSNGALAGTGGSCAGCSANSCAGCGSHSH
jgi:putative FmdB family regulatory protein